MSNVSGIIKSIQDIMRKDVGVDGDAQRISQMVWMFFLKIFDDREEELALLEKNYKSPLPEHLRWRSWAEDPEGITGDELADFVNLQLFPTLKNKINVQGPNGKRAMVVRDIFEDAYNYMKSGTLMRQVINKISEIDFNVQSDRHTFGNIYEQILKDLQSAGNAGEFYTPRAVTKFIVDRVNPQLEETVLDPACGTGGFLTNVIEHKRSRFVKSPKDEEILQESIRGVDKKSLPYMLCMTNMILHGIDTPTNIKHDNTLSRPLRDYTNKDRVNVIVTNPPFGGMEEDGIENNFPATFRSRETADLFVTLIIHLLKDNGRAAIVLPDGFFFGEGMKTRLKEKLLTECNVHTIVRLPNGVFNPYAGIRTNLLFFTKGKSTEQIWYYEHSYPAGVKNYNKTKPIRFEEFHPEIDWWGKEVDGFKARVETKQAWKVSIEDIKARNYNLDIKNPHVGEQINHDPDELLNKYTKQQTEITNLRDQLKNILAKAFNVGETAWQRIADHFDTLFTTEQSIDLLKQTILQLAVKGKLVTQNPKDEPASILLKKINDSLCHEKNIKSLTKLKRDKSTIDPKEFHCAIPGNWIWCELQDISIFTNGKAHEQYVTKESKYILINSRFVSTSGQIIKYATERLAPLEKGDIAIVMSDVPDGRALVRCFLVEENEKYTLNQRIGCIASSKEMNKEYLMLVLDRNKYYLQYDDGQKQTNLKKIQIISCPIPLPPLAEQQRIVTKVYELMTLCDTLKARLKEAQTTQIQLADVIVEQAVM